MSVFEFDKAVAVWVVVIIIYLLISGNATTCNDTEFVG